MIECNEILRYLPYFYYDEEMEKTIIKHDPNAELAEMEYEHTKEILGIESGSHKNWVLDVALDCLKNMKRDDKNYINAGHLHTSEYHFGYSMFIRNKYLWHAKMHMVGCADSVSSEVMEMIFTLLNPVYDYRNGRLCEFFDHFDYSKLVELYWDTYEALFWEVADKIKTDSTLSGDEGIEEIKCRIRHEIGMETFKSIFCDLVNEFADDKDYKTREERFERELRYRAFLFPKECNQITAIKKLSITYEIHRKNIKCVEDCMDYIIKNLGFRDGDALFMAECVWEAYQPKND